MSAYRLEDRIVLVTGALGTLGAAMCGAIEAAGGTAIRSDLASRGKVDIALDVTKEEDWKAAAEHIAKTHGRLDGLVNNAGIAIAAPLEDLPLEELRRQLEVNVVGQLAVTKALLPAVRAARGRIVLVGSIAGRSALPFLGAYAISKFSLEAMADSLRVELRPDGIEVSLVEPATIATPMWTKPQPLAEGVSERYRRRLEAFRAAAAERASRAEPVDLVADAVEHALSAERPKTRYLVGRDAKLRAGLQILPDRVRDRVIARVLLGG
jgi:NAD(P)-dependent dehydrogenase (short-subunit alcohol dehydrogenase family)